MVESEAEANAILAEAFRKSLLETERDFMAKLAFPFW